MPKAMVQMDIAAAPTAGVAEFRMTLGGAIFYPLGDGTQSCNAAALQGRRLHAVAGIGAPPPSCSLPR